MPKLDPTTANELRDLINRLEVARIMFRDPKYSFDLWYHEYCTVTVKLADDYGITLPTVADARVFLETVPDPLYLETA
jgi:hypothetical protein